MASPMISDPKPKSSFFTPYFVSDVLLIQFLIEEFIHTTQLHLQFAMLVQELSDQHVSPHSLSPSFTHLLNQMVGHTSWNSYSPLSTWTCGPLTKFKDYAEQLSRNSHHQNKLHHTLHIAGHQAWLTVVHNLELLKSSDSHLHHFTPPSTLFSTPLKQTSVNLGKQLAHISSLIPKITQNYWNNENVVLYLLKKEELLNEIYGKGALYEPFKCPLSKQEIKDFLEERYISRGFETIQPLIFELFNRID